MRLYDFTKLKYELEKCPKDKNTPAGGWKTYMQIANANSKAKTGGDGHMVRQTVVTLYALSTILWIAEHKNKKNK